MIKVTCPKCGWQQLTNATTRYKCIRCEKTTLIEKSKKLAHKQ